MILPLSQLFSLTDIYPNKTMDTLSPLTPYWGKSRKGPRTRPRKGPRKRSGRWWCRGVSGPPGDPRLCSHSPQVKVTTW